MRTVAQPTIRGIAATLTAALLVSTAGLMFGGRAVARAFVWRLRAYEAWPGRGEPVSPPGRTQWRSALAARKSDGCRGPLVLAFGDSLIAGYGLEAGESFAARLQQRLQAEYAGAQVINAGRNGDTTGTAVVRLREMLPSIRDAKPDLAIVQLGANDLILGIPLTTMRANLKMIVAELRRAQIPVLLAEIKAPVIFGAFGQACAAIYAELSSMPGVGRAAFFPKRVFANPRFCLPDRIHPNAVGMAAITEGFYPAVRAALAADAVNQCKSAVIPRTVPAAGRQRRNRLRTARRHGR